MTRMIRVLAICLALVLASMLYGPPVSLADGPRSYCVDSGPSGGDGHPWDDGTGQDSTPGDSTGTDLQVKPADPSIQPALSSQKGIVTWTQRTLVTIWYKLRQLAQSKVPVTKTSGEFKTKQSRNAR